MSPACRPASPSIPGWRTCSRLSPPESHSGPPSAGCPLSRAACRPARRLVAAVAVWSIGILALVSGVLGLGGEAGPGHSRSSWSSAERSAWAAVDPLQAAPLERWASCKLDGRGLGGSPGGRSRGRLRAGRPADAAAGRVRVPPRLRHLVGHLRHRAIRHRAVPGRTHLGHPHPALRAARHDDRAARWRWASPTSCWRCPGLDRRRGSRELRGRSVAR